MIKIYQPVITFQDGHAKLSSSIYIDGKILECHAIVDREYAQYLCDERSDAFLIGLLHRAMRWRHDIICEAPVSEEILYGIRNFLMPNLVNNCKNMSSIEISADAAPSPDTAGAVGTGMSAGVDSFQCVLENMDIRHPAHRISHLCFFNCGAFYSGGDIFYEMIPGIAGIASHLGLPLVVLDSNIHTVIFGDFQITHTFYSLFCVYALRKLFGTYIYASAYALSGFKCKNSGIIGYDTAYYDMMIFHCLSGQNLMLYSGGSGLSNRIEKTRTIMDDKLVRDNLRVCMNSEVKNCGKCRKCRRTMMTLWLLNRLDEFEHRFPVDYFYQNKVEYINHMIKEKGSDIFELEVYNLYCKKFGTPQ